MRRVLAAPRAELRHLETVRIVLPVLRRRVRARPAGLARERDDRAVVLWHIRLLQDLRHRVLRSNFLLRHRRVSLPVSPPRGSNPRPRPYQGRALPTELGGQSSPSVLDFIFSGHEKRVAWRNSLEPLGSYRLSAEPQKRARNGQKSLGKTLEGDDRNTPCRLLLVVLEAGIDRGVPVV